MIVKLIEYQSPEYRQMVDLRYRILREPLKLTFTEQDLLQDKNEYLIGCFDSKNTILGCCILRKSSESTMQLRQMAADTGGKSIGVGSQLLKFGESLAMTKGYRYMYLHAREVAIGFYQKHGYEIESDKYTEVGISHYDMMKTLE